MKGVQKPLDIPPPLWHSTPIMKNNNHGYTLTELFIGLAILAIISLCGVTLWAACHFIAKFW